jgi:hypothetical protein
MDTLPTKSIRGLEVFGEGKWNGGDVYTVADFDSMVGAFPHVGFQPTVKAGHQDGQEDSKVAKRLFGEPALGYVERIYRKGDKLMADLKDVSRRFAALLKAGTYKHESRPRYFGDTPTPRGELGREF